MAKRELKVLPIILNVIKVSVCHKVLIRPIITTLIAKTTSQLLPHETQFAAAGVVAVPSKR